MNKYQTNKKIANFFSIFLIIYFAYIATDLIWQLIVDDNFNTLQEKILNTNKKNNTTLNLPMNLFGVINNNVKKKFVRTQVTKLNHKLIGVLNRGSKSLAIIKANGIETVYKIGDKISPLVTIKDVRKKYVILSNNGVLEKLQLETNGANLLKDNNIKQKKAGKTSTLTERQKIKVRKYKQQLITKPFSLFDIVGIKPKYNNSKLVGLIAFPTKEKRLFYSLGLKKNDLIIGMNNKIFRTILEAIKLGQSLLRQESFTLTIQRNKQNKVLYINL